MLLCPIAAGGKDENELCSMVEWWSMKRFEIPAHGPLEVERHELTNEFDIYDEAGEKLCYLGTPYLFFRHSDGKRFKLAQFGDFEGATIRNCIYLQEV
jgi:hypothetical protein